MVHWDTIIAYHRSSRSVCVLQGEMAVVPTASILYRSERVGEIVLRSNRTLSDPRHSVRLERVFLSNTMPMHARTVESQVVIDIDVNGLMGRY
jgi:hypothetical protein